MKITCERDALLTAFQAVAPVVPSRSAHRPILQNIKLEATEASAALMGTDTEIGIRVRVDGITVSTPGQVLLPTVRFGSILRESTDEYLELEADPSGTVVKGSRSNFKLPGEDPLEFPVVADFDQEQCHRVPVPQLRELIKRTGFATDPQSHRFALGGVLLEFGEESLTAVGTDGRRMAVAETPAARVEGHSVGELTIVPARAMTIIDRALSDSDGDCQLAVRGSNISVRSEKVTIDARLLEGKFPRWRDVLPASGGQRIDIPTGPLYSAVRQAAIVTSEESRGIDLHFATGQLTCSARAVGESKVELPISYEGPDIQIALDHRFLTEFFRVLDAQKPITLHLTDGESPAMFTTDDGYRYVVMPLSRDQD